MTIPLLPPSSTFCPAKRVAMSEIRLGKGRGGKGVAVQSLKRPLPPSMGCNPDPSQVQMSELASDIPHPDKNKGEEEATAALMNPATALGPPLVVSERLVALLLVRPRDDVAVMASSGDGSARSTRRSATEGIAVSGRAARGTRAVELKEGERIASVVVIPSAGGGETGGRH